MAEKADLAEIGVSGLRRSGGVVSEEFLTGLRGSKGAAVYREMQDNDAVIGSILFAIEKIICRLDWRVDPYEDTPADVEVAQFVESCLNDMSDSWDSTLAQIMSMLPFGWSFHEIVYKKRGGYDAKDSAMRSRYDDGKIGWRKFAIRSQESLNQWVFDDEGGIQAMQQLDYSGGGIHTIPIEKGLLFRVSTAKNNPEGRSLLRNAYRSWYFKRRIEEIEAIGIERDLAGLPIAYVPPEFLSTSATSAQKMVLAEIQNIVTSVKRNEQEGVVFPSAYDERGNKMFELTLLSSGGSRQFDTDAIIARYDQRIAMSVLSDFILLGHERVGSFALGASKIDLWTMAVDSIAKSIAEVVNQHAIPRLLKLNGMDASRSPYLVYSEVSHIDLTEMAEYVSKLAQAGALNIDSTLEDYLRELGGLPPVAEATDTTAQADDNALVEPATTEPAEEPKADATAGA